MDTPEYFNDVSERSTLRQLISFMLEGEEALKPECIINEDIEVCDKVLCKALDECSGTVQDDIVAAVVDYLIACEHAYMKQGMQTGFRLAVELLTGNEKQPLPAAAWKAWQPHARKRTQNKKAVMRYSA